MDEVNTFTSNSTQFYTAYTVDFSWNYDRYGTPVFEFALSLIESLDFVRSDGCGGLMNGSSVDIHLETIGRPTKKQRHELYTLEDTITEILPQYDWSFHTHYGNK